MLSKNDLAAGFGVSFFLDEGEDFGLGLLLSEVDDLDAATDAGLVLATSVEVRLRLMTGRVRGEGLERNIVANIEGRCACLLVADFVLAVSDISELPPLNIACLFCICARSA